jgi:hypothetical protein
MLNHQFAVWQTQIDPHMKQLAGFGALRAFHHHAATANPIVKALKLSGLFLY